MEQGPTFLWYEPSHLSVLLLSNCVGCRGDFPLPMGQSPLSPIDLHLQLFLRESAYLSHSFPLVALFFLGDASHRLIPSFIFSFASPRGTLTLVSTKSRPGFPGYREFAVHFIITLDGNKLSKRCARACNPGIHTRYFTCFCDTVHKSCEYATSRQK